MDMNGPPPGADDLARRLIEQEESGRDEAETLAAAVERALQALRQELVRLLGADGFSALEARAVELARRRYSFLGGGGNGGSRAGALDEARAGLAGRDPREARDALQAVCAHLIGLLFTFLGEQLTTHLVHLARPDLPGKDPESRERETR
ncbi:MAG TPA: hypothetical protein VFQ38_04730 [Longimicrobiales bacterium]|nr:hypothetical protein [Longimicrobiales bacterium]